MGSPFNLVLVMGDSTEASRLADSCFSLVDSLNHVFSDYDSTSELTRVNNTAGLNMQVYLSTAVMGPGPSQPVRLPGKRRSF
jgi:thiamine biosynthesis lipoprotein ApbE